MEKVRALEQILTSSGIQVDEDTLPKYLALKYLRNCIIRPGEPSEEQRSLITDFQPRTQN